MDDGAASLCDVDPRLLIVQKKQFLNPANIGMMALDESLQIGDDVNEFERECFFRDSLDHSVIEDFEFPVFLAEKCESDRGRPWIDTQNY